MLLVPYEGSLRCLKPSTKTTINSYEEESDKEENAARWQLALTELLDWSRQMEWANQNKEQWYYIGAVVDRILLIVIICILLIAVIDLYSW